MKKIVVLIFLSALISCNAGSKKNTVQPNCYNTASETFDAISKAVENKNLTALQGILAYSPNEYLDTLVSLDNPSIKLIPKQQDGAYGEFDRNGINIYYLFILSNNKIADYKVLQLKNVNHCWKIWNFSNFSADISELENIYNSLSNNTKEYATVTSIADGMDIKQVNLWSSTDGNTRKVVGYCVNNEKVEVMEHFDPYVKVKKTDGTEGWFMEGFLKK